MENTKNVLGVSLICWSLLVFTGILLMFLVAPLRNYDIYDISGGIRALNEQPLLLIGGQIVYGWAGVVLVFLVLSFYETLPAESRNYITRAATAFGVIAGAIFLLYGLVGSFASFDLRYVQSMRSTEYVQGTYLPLILILNRTLAAAVTTSGLWFLLANWVALHNRAIPAWVAYLGMGAGVIALPGFVLPGGGFSLLSLLFSAMWGVTAGLHWSRRGRTVQAVP